MPSSTLFTDAMVLTSAGDGVYDGELNEHWTIGEKVHGGAMLALCANAARTELGEGQPIAISGNFLWAPDPGSSRSGPATGWRTSSNSRTAATSVRR